MPDIEKLRDSTCIVSSSYEFPDLEITFHDGRTVTYHGVSPLVYANFLRALSPGWFFNKYIRNNYSFD